MLLISQVEHNSTVPVLNSLLHQATVRGPDPLRAQQPSLAQGPGDLLLHRGHLHHPRRQGEPVQRSGPRHRQGGLQGPPPQLLPVGASGPAAAGPGLPPPLGCLEGGGGEQGRQTAGQRLGRYTCRDTCGRSGEKL